MSKKPNAPRPRRKVRHFTVGTAAGTLVTDPQAPPPVMHVFAYGKDGLEEHPLATLADLPALRKKWPVVWLNVDGLGDANTIQEIGRQFELHPLSLEDVVNVQQRPKVETYEHYQFV